MVGLISTRSLLEENYELTYRGCIYFQLSSKMSALEEESVANLEDLESLNRARQDEEPDTDDNEDVERYLNNIDPNPATPEHRPAPVENNHRPVIDQDDEKYKLYSLFYCYHAL